WYKSSAKPLTIDGFQLTDEGYAKFSSLLIDQLVGKASSDNKGSEKDKERIKLVHEAVLEKSWMWQHDFKMPNGVHAYGRRYNPFGPDNYPAEIKKLRQLTAIRDSAIWMALKGEQL